LKGNFDSASPETHGAGAGRVSNSVGRDIFGEMLNVI
jgi:hypothetical protein